MTDEIVAPMQETENHGKCWQYHIKMIEIIKIKYEIRKGKERYENKWNKLKFCHNWFLWISFFVAFWSPIFSIFMDPQFVAILLSYIRCENLILIYFYSVSDQNHYIATSKISKFIIWATSYKSLKKLSNSMNNLESSLDINYRLLIHGWSSWPAILCIPLSNFFLHTVLGNLIVRSSHYFCHKDSFHGWIMFDL